MVVELGFGLVYAMDYPLDDQMVNWKVHLKVDQLAALSVDSRVGQWAETKVDPWESLTAAQWVAMLVARKDD